MGQQNDFPLIDERTVYALCSDNASSLTISGILCDLISTRIQIPAWIPGSPSSIRFIVEGAGAGSVWGGVTKLKKMLFLPLEVLSVFLNCMLLFY